tara:strand:+ start:68031 stop:68804 length:774 start_codon:yes stop_codon:yes gene_type:complete
MAAGKTRKKLNTKGSRSSGGGGSTITYGPLNPPTGGSNGDYYISSELGINIWLKDSGSWSLLFSLETTNIDLDSLTTSVYQNQYYNIVSGPTTFLPGGVSAVRVQALSNDTADTPGVFDNNAEAFVTAVGQYVPCTYDVANNTLVAIIEQEFLIIDDGATTLFITPIKDCFAGVTYSIGLTGSNTPYEVTASSSCWTTNTIIIGGSARNDTGDPTFAYGEIGGANQLFISIWNASGLFDEPKGFCHGITFKTITLIT